MKTQDILLFGGLGLAAYWLFSSKSGTTSPFSYPFPGTAAQPKPATGTGSTGGGGGGGSIPGTSGGGSSGSGIPRGTPNTGPVASDTGDPCDTNSYAYDQTACDQINGVSYTSQQPQYTQCMDGSYTNDPSTCPENQIGYQDTLDPCDPNSIMYDLNQCGTAGTTQYDSMDPCDPTSVAYDYNTCYGYQTVGYL
jgi:hypothetical protein